MTRGVEVFYLRSSCKVRVPVLFGILLLILLLLFQMGKASAQFKKFNESFVEIDAATAPYKRCIVEVNLVQGFLADTGMARFTKYPGYFLMYNWLHYYPTQSIRLTAGFYYGRNFEVGEVGQPWMNEYRFLPMAVYNVPSRRLFLSHRIAMDFRWLVYENKTDYKTRVRYRFKALVPLNKGDLVKGTLFAVGMEEIFFSEVRNTGQQQLFEQNRITLNLGYCFSDNVQWETGITMALQPYWGTGEYWWTNIYFTQVTVNNVFAEKIKKRK
jgi:hypothetical protein